ncbi:hypothetical protein [Ottowia thiooxydans]|uniref:hypothetical protein n=1 Tax=Ottowia thiooxydans TaxID=219182 RepID=UPI00041765D1|nr:hypothetical protein [Ottowia thiooxydans]
MVSAAGVLSACSPGSSDGRNITYPSDGQISAALDAQLAGDPNSASARELIQSLGGEKGKLKYSIQQVIYREPAFEVHYDAALVMAQAGEQSLEALYSRMIPEEVRAKLPNSTLAAYTDWLNNHAQELLKDPAQKAQGAALTSTMTALGKCYGGVKPGEEVVVMKGLGAHLLPERKGLFAEKLAMPNATVNCLPI